MSVGCSMPWSECMYESSLTKDEQFYIFRWYPILGGAHCAQELGTTAYNVHAFADRLRIPKMNTEYVMTCGEVASKLGMTEIEVQTIFNSGMRKLREKFKDNLKARQLLKDLE